MCVYIYIYTLLYCTYPQVPLRLVPVRPGGDDPLALDRGRRRTHGAIYIYIYIHIYIYIQREREIICHMYTICMYHKNKKKKKKG